jgi:hypothetical protein
MRKLSFVAVLTALAFSSAVSATTVQLQWTGASDAAVVGVGTSVVDVSLAPGPVLLTLDVLIGIDANGLSSAGMDLEFDTDGANELDLVSYSEFTWANAKATRNLGNLSPGIARTQESTNAEEGQAFGFETFTLGLGAQSITLTFARVVFSTEATRAIADGSDIFATNERDPSATVFFDNNGLAIQIPLAGLTAAVNGLGVIPEPGTIGLLGLGLVSLAVASRRRS